MGSRFLTDTNAIIDFFKNELPIAGTDFLSSFSPEISIITYIELLSKSKVVESEALQIKSFISIATIYDVNHVIAEETIKIRKEYRIKLPDAVIAATAMYYDLTLVTRNIKDFEKVANLKIINPHLL